MKVLYWIVLSIFLLCIGSVVSVLCELGLSAAGLTLGDYGMGVVTLLIVTLGLIMYGTRKQK